MPSLDSSEWSELRHAYGSASDIPPLLRQLADLPDSSGQPSHGFRFGVLWLIKATCTRPPSLRFPT